MILTTVAVIKLQSKDPNVFGEHGANSRVFLIDVSFNLGLMLGPLLSGSLTEVFGFYYSCGTWGVISLLLAFLTFLFFDSGFPARHTD
ncbi:hypothetical protein EYZ11_009145 [Aspergillus tanneri]|uniref:Major facilitator superfamily (MFS) profile domain-containing protein n=1 Tax=Aspergillus tanneri TaxID=1220188 RepID=A0A4S3J8R8_9EURO|nr:hypothetical protein EYZ11_009145 [Aspergillus tanneri]